MTTPAEPPAIDEAAALETVKKLMEYENDGARLELAIGPFTAYTLTGSLQTMLRHPQISPMLADVLTQLARQLQDALAAGPVPGLRELLELGFDERYDR